LLIQVTLNYICSITVLSFSHYSLFSGSLHYAVNRYAILCMLNVWLMIVEIQGIWKESVLP
jgi:hypothetical protein